MKQVEGFNASAKKVAYNWYALKTSMYEHVHYY